MSRRRLVPASAKMAVLVDNLHTCCICRMDNLNVQLHHIDSDPGNNKPENLAVVCLNCHSRVSGDEGMGQRYSPPEVAEFKRRWELHCARACEARAERVQVEHSLVTKNAARQRGPDDLRPLFSNPDLARRVGAVVGVEIDEHFGPYLLDRLVGCLQQAGRIRKERPKTLSEFDPMQLIHESVEATKVVFPNRVLKTTVPEVRELAVWVADPDPKTLGARSEDPYDFAGTFLYLVTPLYDEKQSDSFFSGCSALQVIANVLTGKPFLTTDWDEPLGRRSYLHPTDKLVSLGGIVIDRRPIETLYRCRYMTDEQCFADGKRAYRVHDLLAYPLFIGNSLEALFQDSRAPRSRS